MKYNLQIVKFYIYISSSLFKIKIKFSFIYFRYETNLKIDGICILSNFY